MKWPHASYLCGIALALSGATSCGERAASAVPQWELSDALVRIGGTAAPQTEFHRVADAVRLNNGEIVVADGGSNQVRYFEPDGTLLRAFGRHGSGPGEFQGMGRLMRAGDTLALYDGRNRRLTLFRGDSLLDTRSVRLTNSAYRFSITDRLPDGRWLASTSVSPRFTPQPYRDSIAIGLLPASGEGDVHILGWFPGPWIVSIEGLLTGFAGFFSWPSYRVATQEIVVLAGDQERLRRFRADGSELPGGAIPIRGQPLTPAMIETAKEQERTQGLDPAVAGKWLEVRYASPVLPSHLPLRGFLIDAQGLIWLEEHRVDGAPGRYAVLTPDARMRASVVVPSGFRATEIGTDYCLGVETDSDGVESIVMYRLKRA